MFTTHALSFRSSAQQTQPSAKLSLSPYFGGVDARGAPSHHHLDEISACSSGVAWRCAAGSDHGAAQTISGPESVVRISRVPCGAGARLCRAKRERARDANTLGRVPPVTPSTAEEQSVASRVRVVVVLVKRV